jgi:FkbM family methyltransferase
VHNQLTILGNEMGRISILINHLKRGTALRRVHFEKVKKTAISNASQWKDFLASDKNFLSKEIFNDIKLNLYKDSSLSESLFKGDFEYQEVQFLNSFLKPNDVFIDIGANIGYFSIIASKRVASNGKVYSFEPTDKTYERLRQSLILNNCNNVHTYQVALSDKCEQREFTTSTDGFDAYNSLGSPSQGASFSKDIVQTQTFDFFQKEHNIPTPTLIKIDVEGWEIPVIEGMKETLEKANAPFLIVEFTEDNAQLSGFTCADLYDLIISFGYSLYKYNWVRNELIKQDNKDYYSYTNLIAMKDDSEAKKRLKNVFIS